ncbi:MAG: hypothetical protein SF187_12795 [Deltaproteobacteria bacterium]|nr:hypothetical protein [Deltaproteobacteria bacterium]
MSFKVFLSQMTIDDWVATDRVDLQGEYITLRPDGLRLRLAPAAFFKAAAGGSADVHGLVGKVKDQFAINALGGEAYMSSVVVGEAAYDVEPGFVATSETPTATTATLMAAISAARG